MSIFFIDKSPMYSPRGISASLAACGFVIAFIVFSNHVAPAQQQRNSPPPPPRPTMGNMDPLDMPPVFSGGDPMQARQNEKRLQYLNAERQKSMVAETNRLVKMAADLNAQINSGERSQLTPDQVRQLAEIEKLAHRIRDRMSTSVRMGPAFESNPMFLPSSR